MENKNLKSNKNSLNIFLNKYFNLILSFFVLVLLVVSYFLFIGPKFNSTRSVIQDNISNQKSLYAQQKKKYNSLKAIAKTYAEIPSADLQKFNTVLPSKYPQEKLFGEFEEIINKGGWILNSVQFSSADEGVSPATSAASSMTGSSNERVQKITVTLSVQAIDYAGMKSLLKILENNVRLFDVIDIYFSGESAEIILNTYYYGDPAQPKEEVVK